MVPQRYKFLERVMKKFKIFSREPRIVKYIYTKRFNGNNSSHFYDKEYYEKGTKSNYGQYDKKLKWLSFPYQERYYLPVRMKLAQSIVQKFGIKNALDLGCGKGYFVKALRKCGVEAYGVDTSEYAVLNCPRDVRNYVYQGDICDLSYFEDNQFEMVMILNVLEHIAIPDLYTAINEAVRVSNEYVLIYIKLARESNSDKSPTMISKDKSHLSIYPKEWWKGEFEKCGLKTVLEEVDIYPDGTEGIAYYFANAYQ